ncbi:MAG: alkaline phosphatase family protein [Clostridiales bacterium]|jgi:predicted AlkP superfamily pyrophosphatase or phosphodiesterase|nr:alkaline phosphatase family protein [Clostridiales bacterium]
MDIVLPDYSNSILGIPNSIMAHYGAEPINKTLSLLDSRLAERFKNVAFIIFDGMGSDMLEANIPNSFLCRHKVADISSVYPSTTTAAITCFSSGLSPIEHGWLGWSCWFEEIGKAVDLFSNKVHGSEKQASREPLASKYMPFKPIEEKIAEVASDLEICRVSPFSQQHKAYDIGSLCSSTSRLLKKEGNRLILAYSDQPDHSMHEKGCYAPSIKSMMQQCSRAVEDLCEGAKDTLFIITADHGLTDVETLCIEDYPEINECLSMPPTLESRCISLFVKEKFREAFPEKWREVFEDRFILMAKWEALETELFGPGTPHAKSLDFLGDYIALAVSDICITSRGEDGSYNDFAAAHAGLSMKEMVVPLIVVES